MTAQLSHSPFSLNLKNSKRNVCTPIVRSATGTKLYSVENKEYIDYSLSNGSLILGHSNNEVLSKMHQSLDSGIISNLISESSLQLSEAIYQAIPSMEVVNLLSSAEDALEKAGNLAMSYTGRNKIIRFDDTSCYSSCGDFLFDQVSNSAYCTSEDRRISDRKTIVAVYNDLQNVEDIFALYNESIAAIIVEPIATNMGLVLPETGFLEGLRALCTKHGSLLIFDETTTGFRVCYGGAQQYFDVTPDLTVLGKIIGGGLPLGVLGGSKKIMAALWGDQSYTNENCFSANSIAVSVGLITLDILKQMDYDALQKKVETFSRDIEKCLSKKGISTCVNRFASMFSIFFTDNTVTEFDSARTSNPEQFQKFYDSILDAGIYISPSNFSTAMLSFVHTDCELENTLSIIDKISFN